MGRRFRWTLTPVLVTIAACSTATRSASLDSSGPGSTVLGQWVLATPIDSTAFAGAAQVDLRLVPGSFSLMVTYPDRLPVTVTGRADVADGMLTLVPETGGADVTKLGFRSGQPFTRVATVSGSTLVLAPPTSRVPVPSSVWYRLDAARVAGLARER